MSPPDGREELTHRCWRDGRIVEENFFYNSVRLKAGNSACIGGARR
jgi:hypothetical protein